MSVDLASYSVVVKSEIIKWSVVSAAKNNLHPPGSTHLPRHYSVKF